MNNKWLLIVAAVLVAIGIFKPSLENINIPLGPKPQVVVVDELNLPEPKTPELRVKANDVIQELSISADRRMDAKRLAGLYNDMANDTSPWFWWMNQPKIVNQALAKLQPQPKKKVAKGKAHASR